MRAREDKYGYERVNLQQDKKKITVKVHWAVLSAFNPITDQTNLTVDHIDGNKKNNHISNLRWVNFVENIKLANYRDAEQWGYFINELELLYSKDEIAEILKQLLVLARMLSRNY